MGVGTSVDKTDASSRSRRSQITSTPHLFNSRSVQLLYGRDHFPTEKNCRKLPQSLSLPPSLTKFSVSLSPHFCTKSQLHTLSPSLPLSLSIPPYHTESQLHTLSPSLPPSGTKRIAENCHGVSICRPLPQNFHSHTLSLPPSVPPPGPLS